MKRRIFKLCLFLLLGAIINVAVAWGCVFVLGPCDAEHAQRTAGRGQNLPDYANWQLEVRTIRAGQFVDSRWYRPPFVSTTPRDPDPVSFLPSWAALARPDSRAPARSTHRIQLEARGWPLLGVVAARIEHRSPSVQPIDPVWNLDVSTW